MTKKELFFSEAKSYINKDIKLAYVGLAMNHRNIKTHSPNSNTFRRLRDVKYFIDNHYDVKDIKKVWNFVRCNKPYNV